MTIAIVGLDLGKSICSVAGFDATGAVVLRRRMRRQSVIELGARGCRGRSSPWKPAAAHI